MSQFLITNNNLVLSCDKRLLMSMIIAKRMLTQALTPLRLQGLLDFGVVNN